MRLYLITLISILTFLFPRFIETSEITRRVKENVNFSLSTQTQKEIVKQLEFLRKELITRRIPPDSPLRRNFAYFQQLIESENPLVRIEGLKAIIQFPDSLKSVLLPLAIEELLFFTYLKDKQFPHAALVRTEASKALSILGKEYKKTEVIKRLFEILKSDTSEWVQEVSAKSLSKFGSDIYPDLLKIVRTDEWRLSSPLRYLSCIILSDLEITLSTPLGIIDAFHQLLDDSEKKITIQAMRALINWSKRKDSTLFYFFGKENLRDDLIHSLQKYRNYDVEIAQEIIRALALIFPKDGEVLKSFLESINKTKVIKVWETLIWGLGELGIPEPIVLDILKKIKPDEVYPKLARIAAVSFYKLGEENLAFSYLQFLTRKDSQESNKEAAIGFGELDELGKMDSSIIKLLLDLSWHLSSEVRREAAIALGKVGSPEDMEILNRLVQLTKDVPSVASASINSIAKLKKDSTSKIDLFILDALLDLAKMTAALDLQLAALKALGEIGFPTGLKLMEAYINEKPTNYDKLRLAHTAAWAMARIIEKKLGEDLKALGF